MCCCQHVVCVCAHARMCSVCIWVSLHTAGVGHPLSFHQRSIPLNFPSEQFFQEEPKTCCMQMINKGKDMALSGVRSYRENHRLWKEEGQARLAQCFWLSDMEMSGRPPLPLPSQRQGGTQSQPRDGKAQEPRKLPYTHGPIEPVSIDTGWQQLPRATGRGFQAQECWMLNLGLPMCKTCAYHGVTLPLTQSPKKSHRGDPFP